MSFIKSAMSHFQVRKCNLRVQNPVEFSFPLPKQPAMFQIWATSSAWIWEWRCPGAASPGHSQHCSGCLCNTRWEANFCGFQWLTEQDLGEPSRKQFHKVVRKKNLSCEVPRSDRMGKSDIFSKTIGTLSSILPPIPSPLVTTKCMFVTMSLFCLFVLLFV